MDQMMNQHGPGGPLVCNRCGHPMQPSDSFCAFCGAENHQHVMPNATMNQNNGRLFCPVCNRELNPQASFCPSCGCVLHQNQNIHQGQFQNRSGNFASSAMKTIVSKANNLTGGDGAVDLHLKDLVTNVFKKHSKVEQDEIFICGTAKTTPSPDMISSSWPKPWLYSRVFVMFSIVFALLFIMNFALENSLAIPGLIFIGAVAVPFSTVVFFFEVNAPRNISFFDTIKIFFIGGALSMVATLLIFEFTPVGNLDYIGAVIVGFVEEVGKLLIVYYFCKKINVNYVLNGLLIGSAVGAGFAAFETAGYAMSFLLSEGLDSMMSVIFLRAILAIGGHVIWAAISGAAIVSVKGDQPLTKDIFVDTKFLRVFIIPVVLHAVWDMPLPTLGDIPLLEILLTAVAWVMALIFVNNGLKQISAINNRGTDRLPVNQ